MPVIQLFFAFAEDIGIEGTERFQDLLSNHEVWRKAEAIRGTAAQLLGIVEDGQKSRRGKSIGPVFRLCQ